MPLVSLIDLENSLKMNQFINQQHPQFSHHHHLHQQQQQQQPHGGHHHPATSVGAGAASSSGYFNPNISTPPSAPSAAFANNMGALNANLLGAAGQGSASSNNLIANEILNQIQSMNAINLNSKLLTNLTNNLMMSGIKSSAASNILQGINLNALSQSIQSKQVNYSRYKTELCRQFSENGECKYGDKCQFAHGFNDLKDVNRHPKYKTDFCKTFHSKGFCPYGPRCHFIHDLSEKFDMTILNVASPGPIQTSASQALHDSMIINKYLNMNAYKAQAAAAAAAAAANEMNKDGGQIDKELEAIQMQLTSTLFSNGNEDGFEDERAEEKKTSSACDALKQELHKSSEIKSDKEPMITPQASLDELEVSLSQSLSLLSYAQSPSMSSSSTSSSNCVSSAASSHVSSSGSSKSSSPVSSSSNNIIGEANTAYMTLKSSSEPNIGAANAAAAGKYMVESMFSSSADLSKNDPLSILLLSPSPSPTSSASSSSVSSSRSSASSSNENVYQSSGNLYFNNPLSEHALVNKVRLPSPMKPQQQHQPVLGKPNGGLKTAQSFDKWTNIGAETSDSSLLAINNNSNIDSTALSPSMIQFLRQHCSNNQPASAIKRPVVGQEPASSTFLGMTPVSAPTSAIGSHLSKTNSHSAGAKMDNNNLSSYFNMNNSNNNGMLLPGAKSAGLHAIAPSTKFLNW